MTTRVHILGVPIDAVTRAEAVARCREAVVGSQLFHVVTANPEIVLHAARSVLDRAIITHADLVIPDGVGLLWAARWQGKALLERVTGRDLLTDLCRMGFPVLLLGSRVGVAVRAAETLHREFPQANVGAFSEDHEAVYPPAALWELFAHVRPTVLVVGYGAPTQERWIAAYRETLEALGVRVAIGVGGALDTLSGHLPRAPLWMQRIGLEWLWRLLLEPQRLPRILRATVIFPMTVLRERVRTI